MYFVAEISGDIRCRMSASCDKNIPGKLYNFKEIPYSKFFGFIGEHIFETLRECNNSNTRIDKTMRELFEEHPIEYLFVFRNEREHDQGVSADISDYQVARYNKGGKHGVGHGNKPSYLTRVFKKQLIILFRFENEPKWLNTFQKLWKKRPICLRGALNTKKSIIQSLDRIEFVFDPTCEYYSYSGYTLAPDSVLNPERMLYMYDVRKPENSLYVENLIEELFMESSQEELREALESFGLQSTATILPKQG